MSNEKNKGKRVSHQPDDQLFASLAKTIAKYNEEQQLKGMEPFEKYKQRIKRKVFCKNEKTVTQFMKGYRLIKQRLENENHC